MMEWSRVLEPMKMLAQTENAEASGGLVGALLGPLLMATIFSALGVVVLAISFIVIARILPFSIRKEIEEDQNVALGIVMGAIILGLSIIIAAAMMG